MNKKTESKDLGVQTRTLESPHVASIRKKKSALSIALLTAFAAMSATNLQAAECAGGAEPTGAELFTSQDFRDASWYSGYTLKDDNTYPGNNPDTGRSVFTENYNNGSQQVQDLHPDSSQFQYSNGNSQDQPVVVGTTVDLSSATSDVLVSFQISNVLRLAGTTAPVVKLVAPDLGLESEEVTAPIEQENADEIWTTVSLLIPQAQLSNAVTIALVDMVPVNDVYGDDLAVAVPSAKACADSGTPTPTPTPDGTITGKVTIDGSGEAGITVTLTDPVAGITPLVTTTDANGDYSFENLDDSTSYVVTVSGTALDNVQETDFDQEPDLSSGVATPTETNFQFNSDVAGISFGSSPSVLGANNTYDFGTPEIDSPSTATFSVSNTAAGSAALNVGTLAISGSPLYVLQNDNCSNASVAAGASCSFDVTYTPTSVPATANIAAVEVPTQLGNSTLNLTGLAKDSSTPIVDVDDGASGSTGTNHALVFDAIMVGSAAPVDSVKVTNSGSAPLIISDVSVTDGVFEFEEDTTAIPDVCKRNAEIAAGASCNLAFIMNTGTVGSHAAVATVTTNATPATFNVNLSGVVGDQDSDKDGLFDQEELVLGTNPNNPDTDGDGLNDKQEARDLPTDPLKSDTDGDGENDGDEVGNVDAPTDTDGDTIIDAIEPSNVDTDLDGRPNEVDTDDDADDIPTKEEAKNDLGALLDTDGDTIPDYLESNLLNTDGDAFNNHADPNDDAEGGVTGPNGEVGDDYFRPVDTDGDKIPDYLDADNTEANDSDGDGLKDTEECSNGHPKCEVIEVNNQDGSLKYQIPLYMTTDTNVVPVAREDMVETGVDGGIGATGSALMSLFGLGFALCRRKKASQLAASVAVVTAGMMVAMPHTAEAEQGQWYVGAGAGISKVKPETNGTGYGIDDSISNGFKGILGYDLTDNWSLEGFLSDLGEGKLTPSGEIEYRVGGVGAVYNHDLDKDHGIRGLLKLGVAGIDNDSDNVTYRKVEDTQVFAGIGLEKAFNAGVSLRAEFEYFDRDVRFGSLNLIKRFGGEPEPAPPVVVAKAPVDSDGDTVIDERDECPGTPAGTEVDVRGCTFVADKVVDSDGDGITDARDQCMGTPEGTRVDDTGCPVVKKISGVLEGVNFETDSSNLTSEARLILDHVAVKLNQYDDVQVLVVGHTDNQASTAYNKRLSFDRAKSVASYLVSRGVSAKRMRFIGMGESQPRATNDTIEGRARNRRVELIAK